MNNRNGATHNKTAPRCVVCDVVIPRPAGLRGAVPRYCLEHRDRRNRGRDLRRAVTRSVVHVDGPTTELASAEQAMRALGLRAREPSTRAREAQVAIAIAYGTPIAEAAQQAGITALDAASLAELEARVLARHPGLATRSTTAITDLANETLARLLIRLQDSVDALPANSLASALRQACEAVDRLQGGLQPVYSNVNVTIQIDDNAARGGAADTEDTGPTTTERETPR